MTKEQLKKLAAAADENIDCSDIPETKDFSGWVRADSKNLKQIIKSSVEQQNLQIDWTVIDEILGGINNDTVSAIKSGERGEVTKTDIDGLKNMFNKL